MLGRLHLDDLLHELLARVRDAVGSDTATILLATPEGQLVVRAEIAEGPEVVGEVRVPIGEGIAGTIAQSRRPRIVPDVIAAGARSRFLRERVRSLVGVPIVAGDRLMGVLHTGSREPRQFTDHDVHLLELVAERAALAIEAARMYQVEQSARKEAEAAQGRLAFLAEASTLLAGSLSSPEAFENLARLAVAFLTDLCLIDVVDERGTIHRVAAVHADPSKQPMAQALRERFAPDADGPHPAVAVMREGQSEFAAEITDQFLRRTTRNEAHYRLVSALGFQSYLCVPLTARGAVLGCLTLVSTRSERRYTEADVALAEDLARRAGMAIDNARLLDAEQQARLNAERAAARTAVLQGVTAALSEAATTADVARVVADQILPVLGAGAGFIALLDADGGSLETMADAGYPDAVMQGWRRISVDATVPVAEAVRQGQPVFIASSEELIRRYPALAAERGGLGGALAALPITVRGRTLGAMGVSFPDDREFATEDRALQVALARQCGQALERARLYESERQAQAGAEAAQRRLAFLAEASRILSETLDYGETLERVARLALPVLADLCLIDVLTEGGALERVAAAAARPSLDGIAEEVRRYPPSLSGADPAAVAIRTGQPQVLAGLTDELREEMARDEFHVQALRNLTVTGLISVPLQARGRTLGALTFISVSPRFTFGADDLELAQALALRAALAVDNARLYSERDHIARTLQQSLLPADLPVIPGVDLAARYRPAGQGNEVGGDFYDAFAAGDGSWAVLIGDVCGKGPEAAAVTGLARHTLRAAALGERRPSGVMRLLNQAMLQRGNEQRFCTVAYLRMRPGPEGVRVTVCCAGHPLPLVLRADGALETVGRPGALLGVFREPELIDVPVDLRPGDLMVLYTDGVTEERGEEGFFGLSRLGQVLAAMAGLGAEEVVDAVEHAVVAFRPNATRDDLTVVALRVVPPDRPR